MKTYQGFSLLELMIAVAIVGILALLAYPMYQGHMRRARRSDAKTTLLNLANQLEEQYTLQNSYKGASLSHLGQPTLIAHGHYRLELTDLANNNYLLKAIPAGSQIKDECGTLAIDAYGRRVAKQQGCW